jgi:hypothetical protein
LRLKERVFNLAQVNLPGSRSAIVIGINGYYDNKNFETLKGAENDAREVAEILKTYGNFEIDEKDYPKNLLIGSNATCENIRTAISNIFWNQNPYDIVLFYFSGHGFVDGFQNTYIAPYDIEHDKPFIKGLNMTELNRVVNDYYGSRTSKNRGICMLLDCCHGNSATEGTKSANMPFQSFQNSVNELVKGDGKIIIASTDEEFKAREQSYQHEDKSSHFHGIFTINLLEALAGNPINENDKGAGVITIERLKQYLKIKMQGKQKVDIRAEGDIRIDDIELAIAPNRYEESITVAMQDAINGYEDYNYTKNLYSLKASCESTRKVIKWQPTNTEANRIKNEIDRTLNSIENDMRSWINSNEQRISPDFSRRIRERQYSTYPFSNLYEELQSFERFLNVDDASLCLLNRVCEVMQNKNTDEFNINSFLERCMDCLARRHNPAAAKAALRTS